MGGWQHRFLLTCFVALASTVNVAFCWQKGSSRVVHRNYPTFRYNDRRLLSRITVDAARGSVRLCDTEGAMDIEIDPISLELASADSSFLEIVADLHKPRVSSIDPLLAIEGMDSDQFGSLFRHCAPYISMYRGAIMVLHIPGHILKRNLGGAAISGGSSLADQVDHKDAFDRVVDDIAILKLLGVKLVLVLGVREQVDERVRLAGGKSTFHKGMRVTDPQVMQYLKEESGAARFEIESAFARGFRGMAGAQNGRMNVVSGNFFYTAKTLGVRDGVDYDLTGEVRRIDTESFMKRLGEGDIVLITSLGHSPSGEVFNVPSESLAAECAAKLKAEKIIYFTKGEGIVDKRSGKVVQNMRLAQAVSLLQAWKIPSALYNYLEHEEEDEEEEEGYEEVERLEDVASLEEAFGAMITYTDGSIGASDGVVSAGARYSDTSSSDPLNISTSSSNNSSSTTAKKLAGSSKAVKLPANPLTVFVRTIARSVYALTGGVKRAHLIAPVKGALLKELYTRDGTGMLISRDTYEGVRAARTSDVRAIQSIIRPLEEEGILLRRSLAQLEEDIPNCFLLTRDADILACGMLKPYSATHGEIYCLAVHPSYRRGGRGETLLAYLERRALMMGLEYVFVLSTRTMQWFEERGFAISSASELPAIRAQKIDPKRKSKVYIKKLGSQRDVDAEELLWDIN